MMLLQFLAKILGVMLGGKRFCREVLEDKRKTCKNAKDFFNEARHTPGTQISLGFDERKLIWNRKIIYRRLSPRRQAVWRANAAYAQCRKEIGAVK